MDPNTLKMLSLYSLSFAVANAIRDGRVTDEEIELLSKMAGRTLKDLVPDATEAQVREWGRKVDLALTSFLAGLTENGA